MDPPPVHLGGAPPGPCRLSTECPVCAGAVGDPSEGEGEGAALLRLLAWPGRGGAGVDLGGALHQGAEKIGGRPDCRGLRGGGRWSSREEGVEKVSDRLTSTGRDSQQHQTDQNWCHDEITQLIQLTF